MKQVMKPALNPFGTLAATLLLATLAGDLAGAELTVATPSRGDIHRFVTFPGTLAANQQATLYAKVSGYLKSISVDIGDRVQANQVIAVLDVPELAKATERAAAEAERLKTEVPRAHAAIQVADALVQQAGADVQKAEAQIAADQSEFGRVEELVKTGVVTGKVKDEAENRLRAAKAALASVKESLNVARARERSARADLAAAEAAALVAQKNVEEAQVLMEYTSVRAPFAGIVTARHVDAGAFIPSAAAGSVARTSALVTVMAFDILRAQVPVPEIEATLVQVGQPVVVTVEGLSGRTFPGSVARHAYALDEGTRSLRVEADLKNPDLALRPGMYARIRIGVERHENALRVPAGALLTEKAGASVFLLQDGKAKKTPVKTGFHDGTHVEILSGLKGDEPVLVFGKVPPADGATVDPIRAN